MHRKSRQFQTLLSRYIFCFVLWVFNWFLNHSFKFKFKEAFQNNSWMRKKHEIFFFCLELSNIMKSWSNYFTFSWFMFSFSLSLSHSPLLLLHSLFLPLYIYQSLYIWTFFTVLLTRIWKKHFWWLWFFRHNLFSILFDQNGIKHAMITTKDMSENIQDTHT